MYCPRCGKKPPDVAAFCHACGARLPMLQELEAPPEQRRGTAGRAVAVVLLGAAGALVAVVYGLLPLARHGFSYERDPAKLASLAAGAEEVFSSSDLILVRSQGRVTAGALGTELARRLIEAKAEVLAHRDLPGLLPLLGVWLIPVLLLRRGTSLRSLQASAAVVLTAAAFMWYWTNATDHAMEAGDKTWALEGSGGFVELALFQLNALVQFPIWGAGFAVVLKMIKDFASAPWMPLFLAWIHGMALLALLVAFRPVPYWSHAPLAAWPLAFGLGVAVAGIAALKAHARLTEQPCA